MQVLDCSVSGNVLYPVCADTQAPEASTRQCSAISDPTTCDQEGPFYVDLSTKFGDNRGERQILFPTDTWWTGKYAAPSGASSSARTTVRAASAVLEDCGGATCSQSGNTAGQSAQRNRLLLLHGKITAMPSAGRNEPEVALPDVRIDIWSAGAYETAGPDHSGGYSAIESMGKSTTYLASGSERYWFRGYQKTDANGRYAFLTQFPVIYGDRPVRHVHVMVKTADNSQHLLTTQVYWQDQVPNWNTFGYHASQVRDLETATGVRAKITAGSADADTAADWTEIMQPLFGALDFDGASPGQRLSWSEDDVVVSAFDIRLQRTATVAALVPSPVTTPTPPVAESPTTPAPPVPDGSGNPNQDPNPPPQQEQGPAAANVAKSGASTRRKLALLATSLLLACSLLG